MNPKIYSGITGQHSAAAKATAQLAAIFYFLPRTLFKSSSFFALAFITIILPATVQAQQTLPAAKRLNELGPENSQLAQRVGTWDVTETVWETPGATPTSNKFVAERKMIGSFLQEIIRPLPNSNIPDFQRIYYLSFNRVEGRWKYVSIDTRNPVGLMPAASFGPGEKGKFTLTFDPFALAGPGMNVAGQMLRMEEVFSQQDANHDTGEEYFILADGSGKRWLAYKYDYVRRTTPSK